MALNRAQMLNQLAIGVPVVYRGHIISDPADVPTDAQITAGTEAGTPDISLVLGDPSQFSFPVPDAPSNPDAGPYGLVVTQDPTLHNANYATVLVGSDDPANENGLVSFSGSGNAIYAVSVSGNAISAVTKTGSQPALNGSNWQGGPGVLGQSGTGTAGVFTAFDGGASLRCNQPILCDEIGAATVPTPASGQAALFMDIADHVMKVKTSDGTVHALW